MGRNGATGELALPDPIWQREAHGICAADAAAEFARTYWGEPRELVWVNVGRGEFSVADGVSLFVVKAGKILVSGWPIQLWLVYKARPLTAPELERT
jgi:hypothetical protein